MNTDTTAKIELERQIFNALYDYLRARKIYGSIRTKRLRKKMAKSRFPSPDDKVIRRITEIRLRRYRHQHQH